ncbi:hypothetical protein TYRP_006015 [Tyrophagus putrescentiae]|nr:hypothetical protein TYRP_006015 [Tyrophagus putrescentiae]
MSIGTVSVSSKSAEPIEPTTMSSLCRPQSTGFASSSFSTTDEEHLAIHRSQGTVSTVTFASKSPGSLIFSPPSVLSTVYLQLFYYKQVFQL